MLYYAAVILSPFVSRSQLEHMQEYVLSAKQAMYEKNGETVNSIVNVESRLCCTNTATNSVQ